MTEEIKTEENEIYFYFDINGKKFYTPNKEFALIQSMKHGTHKIYVEKY